MRETDIYTYTHRERRRWMFTHRKRYTRDAGVFKQSETKQKSHIHHGVPESGLDWIYRRHRC